VTTGRARTAGFLTGTTFERQECRRYAAPPFFAAKAGNGQEPYQWTRPRPTLRSPMLPPARMQAPLITIHPNIYRVKRRGSTSNGRERRAHER